MAEARGYTAVFGNVIILTQPAEYRKKISTAMPLFRLFLRKYPAIIDAMAVRHLIYNRQIEEIREREEAGTAFVIRPPQRLLVDRLEHDPEKLRQTYDIGRKEMQKRLDELKAFLKQ